MRAGWGAGKAPDVTFPPASDGVTRAAVVTAAIPNAAPKSVLLFTRTSSKSDALTFPSGRGGETNRPLMDHVTVFRSQPARHRGRAPGDVRQAEAEHGTVPRETRPSHSE